MSKNIINFSDITSSICSHWCTNEQPGPKRTWWPLAGSQRTLSTQHFLHPVTSTGRRKGLIQGEPMHLWLSFPATDYFLISMLPNVGNILRKVLNFSSELGRPQWVKNPQIPSPLPVSLPYTVWTLPLFMQLPAAYSHSSQSFCAWQGLLLSVNVEAFTVYFLKP